MEEGGRCPPHWPSGTVSTGLRVGDRGPRAPRGGSVRKYPPPGAHCRRGGTTSTSQLPSLAPRPGPQEDLGTPSLPMSGCSATWPSVGLSQGAAGGGTPGPSAPRDSLGQEARPEALGLHLSRPASAVPSDCLPGDGCQAAWEEGTLQGKARAPLGGRSHRPSRSAHQAIWAPSVWGMGCCHTLPCTGRRADLPCSPVVG